MTYYRLREQQNRKEKKNSNGEKNKMETKEKIKQQIVGGLTAIVMMSASCTPAANASGKLHKNCYGLHIREGSNPTVELYKEGWLVNQEPINGQVQMTITDSKITYTRSNGTTTEYVLRHEQITK